MSPAYELVKSLYEDFARKDLMGASQKLDPNIEWYIPEDLPWSHGWHHGVDEVLRFFGRFADHLNFPQLTLEHLVGREDPEHIVGIGRVEASPKGGTPFVAPWAHFWTVRGGKPVRMRGYFDSTPILRALEGSKPLSVWQQEEQEQGAPAG